MSPFSQHSLSITQQSSSLSVSSDIHSLPHLCPGSHVVPWYPLWVHHLSLPPETSLPACSSVHRTSSSFSRCHDKRAQQPLPVPASSGRSALWLSIEYDDVNPEHRNIINQFSSHTSHIKQGSFYISAMDMFTLSLFNEVLMGGLFFQPRLCSYVTIM